MSEMVHAYAGNPLNRGESLRRSEETIAALAGDDTSLFLPFHKLKGANDEDGLHLLKRAAIPADCRQTIFLGTRDNVAHFAVVLPDVPNGLMFTDCRSIAAALTTEETGIVAQARAQLDWHYCNPFCAQCGARSQPERGGQIRRCTSCERCIHPRTDPVAIMLVVDNRAGIAACWGGRTVDYRTPTFSPLWPDSSTKESLSRRPCDARFGRRQVLV